jgi:hypothetical protein
MLFSLNNVFALAAVTSSTIVSAAAAEGGRDSSSKVVDKFEKHLGFGRQHLQQRQYGHKALRAAT